MELKYGGLQFVVLRSDGTEAAGSKVLFNALQNIELMANFEIGDSAIFEAKIDSCVSLVPPAIPPGYLCSEPFQILNKRKVIAPAPIYGNGGSTYNRHSVWYSFTAPANGEIFINSCGFKTSLIVWKGTYCLNTDPIQEVIATSNIYDNGCGETTFEDGSIVENLGILSGEKIFLEWTNRYSPLPFEFNFNFVAN